MEHDHYDTLGVQPTAEPVVITAAYRALAQRYHPDRWTGDPKFAHEQTARLNVAYAILSDPEKRAEYDRHKRTAEHRAYSDDDPEVSDAFDTALQEMEGRWETACSVYPDLVDLRARLSLYSKPVAFSLVALLLQDKRFSSRHAVAESLLAAFLERYFGTNPSVLAFAKSLIEGNERDAAKYLNELVDVLGSEADAELIIGKVNSRFGLLELAKQRHASKEAAELLVRLRGSVRHWGHYTDAAALAKANGYEVTEKGGGIFASPQISAKSPLGEMLDFKNVADFVYWVRTELC